MRLIIVLAAIFSCFIAAATPPEVRFADAAILHRAEKALTDVIVHDIFSPPVASRIYVYANIAAYEILVKGHDGYRSLRMQIGSMPQIAIPGKKISVPLAAVFSFLQTGKKLIFSDQMLQDSIENILKCFKDRNMPKELFDASLEYGGKVSEVILQWAAEDGYKETRKLRRFNFSRQEGKWLPTPPAYMSAVEPYWKMIRPLVLDSASQFSPPPPIVFSKDPASLFYRQASEVFDAVNNLTEGHRAIAAFWDCNPFVLNIQGHMNYASKKISPGGHWISIAGIAARRSNAGIMKSSAAYTLTSIALFDAFISCWEEKYRSNVIRPETYINAYIDESWRPLLQSPPFPEYSSGHSVVSSAAAMALNNIFGNRFSYDDDTELAFGIPARHYKSFDEAGKEAAISRLFGGIHYRAAIENGQEQGRRVGELVCRRIRLKK